MKQGKLDGYGVRRDEGRRIRWYVYADTLPVEPGEADGVRPSCNDQELLTHLLDARKHARLARNNRTSAHRLLMDVVDGMAAALRASREGKADQAFDLLLALQEIRNDEGRRCLTAEQHEADAEACLDAALRSLVPSGEESLAQDDANFASAEVPRLRESGRSAYTDGAAPKRA